ncbi:MAG: peptidoglycan-binding protein [Candidatus Pacebacteria bacterium]|nr:peptidoglycan-binding protein [Candidatus Paceibacterota bacterium]MBP9852106.1 peptidoglycan-binding protein [Candidatus Paceibacterota bacterium]
MKTKRFLAIGAKSVLIAFVMIGMVGGSMTGFISTVSAEETTVVAAEIEQVSTEKVSAEKATEEKVAADVETKEDTKDTKIELSTFGDEHNGGHGYEHDHWDGHTGWDNGHNDHEDHGYNNDHEQVKGSIRVCVLVLDQNWDMLPSSAVSGVTFEIPGITETSVYGDTTGELPSTFVTTPMEKNTRLLDWSTENDANCTTYTDLELGNYYYGQQVITGSNPSNWEVTMYHDDAGHYIYNFDYFTAHSNHLFDDDSTNDWNDVYTADGHIPLYCEEPHATLVVVNRYIPTPVTPPTDDDGGQGGNDDGDGDDNGNGGNNGGNTGGGNTGGGTTTGGGSVGGGSAGPGGSIAGGTSIAAPGQVLGASTCGVYLKDYLRFGYQNDAEEVKKLQTFLNTYLGTTLTVSGTFDTATEAAVRTFQSKEQIFVLTPWNISATTGIVYLTTKTRINNLSCSTLNAPIPSPLVNWSANPETASIAKIAGTTAVPAGK